MGCLPGNTQAALFLYLRFFERNDGCAFFCRLTTPASAGQRR